MKRKTENDDEWENRPTRQKRARNKKKSKNQFSRRETVFHLTLEVKVSL